MMRYFRRRIYQVGITIVLIEIIVLAVVGSFYVYSISNAIDSRVESQVNIPGQLMNAGLLDLDVVGNSDQMSALVGEEYITGMVIGMDHNIYYSLNPEYLGQRVEDIPVLDPSLFSVQNVSEALLYTNDTLVSVSIIYSLDQVTPRFFVYIVVGTSAATAEKNQSTQLFLMGSGAVLALTLIIVALSFNLIRGLELDLVKKERLAVLGTLGAGVSHEIRNPLGSIKSAAYFLRMSLDNPTAEVNETIEILETESLRIEQIVNNLLHFAHPKPPALVSLNLQDVIQKVQSELRVPDDVRIETQLAPDASAFFADFNQLVMVATIIFNNALHAMPNGGQLTINSRTEGANWVILSFVDTGIGIPEESMEKIFQPLFTTKAQGMGLGLAIAKSMVEGHNGEISIQSEVGKGTVVSIKLPLIR
ncbi:MAG: two-component system sensor histidine kinase NtrB [Candidatus Thorarchaeota archaeon]